MPATASPWSFALGLKLAAYQLLRSDLGEDPVLVLDDIFAELDSGRRDRLAHLVEACEQVLITAAVVADVPEVLRVQGTTFMVALGEVTRVAWRTSPTPEPPVPPDPEDEDAAAAEAAALALARARKAAADKGLRPGLKPLRRRRRTDQPAGTPSGSGGCPRPLLLGEQAGSSSRTVAGRSTSPSVR